MPQIQENYALQSGEGLSIFFVFIWLLGDLANVCQNSVSAFVVFRTDGGSLDR